MPITSSSASVEVRIGKTSIPMISSNRSWKWEREFIKELGSDHPSSQSEGTWTPEETTIKMTGDNYDKLLDLVGNGWGNNPVTITFLHRRTGKRIELTECYPTASSAPYEAGAAPNTVELKYMPTGIIENGKTPYTRQGVQNTANKL